MMLEGKCILVTGGASGIGRACAAVLASRGAMTVVADIDRELGEQTVEAIRADGYAARFLGADVTSRAQVRCLVRDTQAAHGRIDVLVHVAAISEHTPFLDLRVEEWQRTIDVCLTGAFHVNQEVARVMVDQRGGRIINFASTAALTGGTVHSAYSAAKAGVIALSKSMQRELTRDNVIVVVVAPGATDTPLYRRNRDASASEQPGSDRPFGRLAQPEEVARVVAFLASDTSSHLLAGQTIHTNGGVFMGF